MLSVQTSLLRVRLVAGRSQSGPFVCQQGHQGLGHHEVRGGDELVLLGDAAQEAGQELPLDGVVHRGQVHAGCRRDQVLQSKEHFFIDKELWVCMYGCEPSRKQISK